MEKVYYYSKENGEYLKTLEKKKGISYPDNTTEIKVIKKKRGFARIFKNGEWIYEKDLRGEKKYNIETRKEKEIDYIGEVIEGWTILPPNGNVFFNNGSWEEIQESREQKIIKIDNKIKEEISKGFVFDEKTFSLSLEAQLNWLMIDEDEKSLTISTLDSQEYVLEKDKIKDFKKKMKESIRDCLSKGRQKKSQLNNEKD